MRPGTEGPAQPGPVQPGPVQPRPVQPRPVQPPAGPTGRQLARVAGVVVCALAAAALVVALFIGIDDRLWRLLALFGAAAAVAGVVVLLPASLRARGRLLVAAFLAAAGVLPLVISADNGPPAPPQPSVNADYLATLIEKGPFTEALPEPLVAGALSSATISGPGAATKVAAAQLEFSVPGDSGMGGGAFIETYRTVDEAAARIAARLEELRTREAPLWADEGDATKGYCVAGQRPYWTCGARHGTVFVEVVVFPAANANHALTTDALTAVLRYTDRMTVLASA